MKKYLSVILKDCSGELEVCLSLDVNGSVLVVEDEPSVFKSVEELINYLKSDDENIKKLLLDFDLYDGEEIVSFEVE